MLSHYTVFSSFIFFLSLKTTPRPPDFSSHFFFFEDSPHDSIFNNPSFLSKTLKPSFSLKLPFPMYLFFTLGFFFSKNSHFQCNPSSHDVTQIPMVPMTLLSSSLLGSLLVYFQNGLGLFFLKSHLFHLFSFHVTPVCVEISLLKNFT